MDMKFVFQKIINSYIEVVVIYFGGKLVFIFAQFDSLVISILYLSVRETSKTCF